MTAAAPTEPVTFEGLRLRAFKIAVHVAKAKGWRRRMNRAELRQVADLAAWHTARLYDPERGKLTTYLALRVHQEFMDLFREFFGRPNLRRGDGTRGRARKAHFGDFLSLDVPRVPGSPRIGTHADQVPDPARPVNRLADLFEKCEEQYRVIPKLTRVLLHVLLDGFTMRQAGEMVGLSESRVSQMFTEARLFTHAQRTGEWRSDLRHADRIKQRHHGMPRCKPTRSRSRHVSPTTTSANSST